MVIHTVKNMPSVFIGIPWKDENILEMIIFKNSEQCTAILWIFPLEL